MSEQPEIAQKSKKPLLSQYEEQRERSDIMGRIEDNLNELGYLKTLPERSAFAILKEVVINIKITGYLDKSSISYVESKFRDIMNSGNFER